MVFILRGHAIAAGAPASLNGDLDPGPYQDWFGAIDPAKADPKQLAFACIGYFVFSLFIMVAAFEVNKVFAAILVLINVLLPSLALSILGANTPLFSALAAWSELGISMFGFYAAGAVFLNRYFGHMIPPMGAPWASSGRVPPQARPNKGRPQLSATL